jgi:hypothetical protein
VHLKSPVWKCALQPGSVRRIIKSRRFDETLLQALHQHLLQDSRQPDRWRLHRRVLRGICKQDRFYCRTPYPNRASGTEMLDRPESRQRCLCGIDSLLQVTEDRKADTLPFCDRREEHVRANQANLDEVGALILLLANFVGDPIGRPGIEGSQEVPGITSGAGASFPIGSVPSRRSSKSSGDPVI